VKRLGEALRLIEGLQTHQVSGKIHRLLSEIHEARGEFEIALRHFKAFYLGEQAIHSHDSQRRIRALLERTAVERARRDADLARQRNEELSKALDEAKVADQRKEALVERLSQQSDMLRQLAREDGLTGLANRRWLDAQYQLERERARRHGHALSVAMIDLDHFKSINDRYTHRVGDEVLRRLGCLMRETFRANDVIGRYGGEEFMAVLVETPLASAAAVCERLRERVAGVAWSELHPELAQVTVSIGLAGDAENPLETDLVLQADKQLYAAKARGRNRVCWQFGAG
jgi:diguanylate cyclase (GGDEF)-like protein